MFNFIFNKWNQTVDPPREDSLSDFKTVKRKLRQCDVVLVEGRKRVSRTIRRLTRSTWTHSALYIGKIGDLKDADIKKIVSDNYDGDSDDKQLLIIESLIDKGTTVSRLDKYDTEHLRICRPAGLSPKNRQRVIRYAASRLGIEYDKGHIGALMAYFIPAIPEKYASSLFQRDKSGTSKTVCSTMIANAFGYVKFPILPLVKLLSRSQHQVFRRNPKLCTPCDFDHSPYFEIIKYPFYGNSAKVKPKDKNYKLLLWKGESELTEEEMKLYYEPNESIDTEEAKEVDKKIKDKVGPTSTQDKPG